MPWAEMDNHCALPVDMQSAQFALFNSRSTWQCSHTMVTKTAAPMQEQSDVHFES